MERDEKIRTPGVGHGLEVLGTGIHVACFENFDQQLAMGQLSTARMCMSEATYDLVQGRIPFDFTHACYGDSLS